VWNDWPTERKNVNACARLNFLIFQESRFLEIKASWFWEFKVPRKKGFDFEASRNQYFRVLSLLDLWVLGFWYIKVMGFFRNLLSIYFRPKIRAFLRFPLGKDFVCIWSLEIMRKILVQSIGYCFGLNPWNIDPDFWSAGRTLFFYSGLFGAWTQDYLGFNNGNQQTKQPTDLSGQISKMIYVTDWPLLNILKFIKLTLKNEMLRYRKP
jgi:hypothetical protein